MIRLLPLLLLAVHTLEQSLPILVSPCPDVFIYDPLDSKPGRWYGVVYLSTDITLHSLWLNIVLDTRAEQLGNPIGDVTTQDYMDFKIENPKLKIKPGPALAVRFFIKYDPSSRIPKVKAIRLNGREICHADTVENRPDIVSRPVTPLTTPPMKPPPSRPGGSPPVYTPIASNSTEQTPYYPGGPNVVTPPNNIPNKPQQPQCGKVAALVYGNPLVVGGTSTMERQWPWQIALYQTQTVDNKYLCGGTLVSLRHVITAAHCVTHKGLSTAVDQNTLTVYLGKHNLRTSVEGVQIRYVERITVHPEYTATIFSRDLSILQLREPVTYTDWVRPACLWPDNQRELSHVVGRRGSVVGWGFDNTGKPSEELTLVEMPVVDQETCLRSYAEFYIKFTSAYTYCAGFQNGTSVCNGDSGGGMVFKIDSTWYLRGLVSLSVAKNNQFRCDPYHYVIFTDLAKFSPWIKQHIK